MENSMSNLRNYSAIGLLENNEIAQQISNLQHHLANKYLGRSAIALPVHITLVRWKSNEKQARIIQANLNLELVSVNLKVDDIDIFRDSGVILYPINAVNELLELSNLIKKNLLNVDISQNNIEISTKFHITLAYKDYKTEQIESIFDYVKTVSRPSNCRIAINRIAVCKQDTVGNWSLFDSPD